MSTDTPAVEVENLVVLYDGGTVLHGVSLTVQPGEIRVVMGGSGSGKSTLLRHMLGLELPFSGSVRVLGENISALRGTQLTGLRKRIGVAFQSGALISSMTVGENILLPLREHTKLDESTMRIMMRIKLEFVRLAGAEHLMPAQLSGGMIKRAALARAMIMDPKVLFLDEPSAGLDPVVAAGIDELILQLRDTAAMTVVVITHELESAFKIADSITVLDHGQILVSGSKASVRASPNDRVQALLTRRVDQPDVDPEAYLRSLTEREVERVRA